MTDRMKGKGAPITAAAWKKENSPTPEVRNRFPGDQVYKYSNSNTIWYAGPTVNRAINAKEWKAMGNPSPRIIQAGGNAPAPNSAEAKIQRDLGTWGCGSVNVKFKNGIIGGETEPWTNTIYLRPDIKAQSYNYILSHECAHMKQYWAYGSTMPGWRQMKEDMNRIYGGTDYSGLEQNADCISALTGNNNVGHYTFNCSGARKAAAQAINNGRRP